MKRGDIWWAHLDAPAGDRPVALISRDKAIDVRDVVVVAPLTTHIRNLPVEVKLTREDGLPKTCVINCDSVATIPKAVLWKRITALSPKKVHELNRALIFALGLDYA